jgi:hypothetical protein
MSGNMYCFEAIGKGFFPHELLANQKCFPSSREDAISAFEYAGSYRTIALKGREAPNHNLWKSYGWTVRLVSGIAPYREDYAKYHTWPC